MEDFNALGDAVDVQGNSLPTTAEVAVQKAKWLAKYLNAGEIGGKFEYKNKAFWAVWRGDRGGYELDRNECLVGLAIREFGLNPKLEEKSYDLCLLGCKLDRWSRSCQEVMWTYATEISNECRKITIKSKTWFVWHFIELMR